MFVLCLNNLLRFFWKYVIGIEINPEIGLQVKSLK